LLEDIVKDMITKFYNFKLPFKYFMSTQVSNVHPIPITLKTHP